jgi:2-alkenal reductase
MQALSRGTSNNLLVGQNVFAFGNPFGLEHSLSRGIISGVSRKMEGAGGRPISGVIQTDASINPGNSGGPLLNSEGKVIGVNTAILTGSGTFAGVGLAIPIDLVQKNVDSIIAKGFVRRPVLGIVFAPDVMAEELQLPGIMVMKVVPGGPADQAGVRSMRGGRLGDVVLGMEGKKVSSTDDLFGILEQKAPGDTISLTVQRATTDVDSDKTEEKVLKVTLGAVDAPKAA